ncbi:potassium-transporting ATPase subunit KdpC [Paracoccus aminophilus]|uniref:Potassium-transporting ATPase KdpC subunit n=1 Tax=Paracoccus aminophilus JCM 7686 TaxID=1367847 RepID=S5XU45_PARAH|nr:potassium-transporting ATPase subunit KdpC [Paracoccus aminophilus]AGT11024.1 K+-transporting ATPase ATPase C chain [Paracoccus aminophilus JCM 7686]
MISQIRPALVFVGFFSVLLGLAYPLAMTGVGQVLFPEQAGGSLIERDGRIVGSSLIGQEFTEAKYLHGRPSATEPAYNAEASSGSNLGPSSAELLGEVKARAEAFGPLPVPSEMATASGSGLDPHITLRAAMEQVPRIAAARDLAENDVIGAIRGATTGAGFGFVGDRIVNVLKANLALDALKG